MRHDDPGLLPRPKHLELREGRFSCDRLPAALGAALRVRAPRPRREAVFAALRGLDADTVRLRPSESLGPGAFRLELSERGLDLNYGDGPALGYALAVLDELMSQDGGSLPCLAVEDAPDFAMRGYLLDVSRCKVPTLDSLKALVRTLARLRYNQLQLYIEHSFAFERHPLVWAGASPLTAAEIRELDDYCRDWDIELVPNFNSFGHFERWLRHAPYRHLAESPEGFVHPLDGKRRDHGSTLKPDEASLALLRELYAEYLPNFRSASFNVGGDEPWELGKGASRERVEREGEGAVYLDFLKRIHAEVCEHGRVMQFWGDLINRHPQLIPGLPRPLLALNWGYEADSPHAEQLPRFREAGIPVAVCPGTSSWRSLVGRWTNASQNLLRSAEAGLANGACGYLLTDWGDGGHHQFPAISWPALVAGGLYAWGLEANRSVSIAAAIDAIGFEDSGGQAEAGAGVGELLCELGRLTDGFPWQRPNRGLLHELLFENDYGAEFVAQFEWLDAARLEELSERIRGQESRLERTPAGGILRTELGLTLLLARLALLKFARRAGRRSGDDEGFDRLAGRALERYPGLWLARNRPGGLDESLGLLRGALGR